METCTERNGQDEQTQSGVIPKKQRSSQSDWTGALQKAYESPNVERANQLVERGVETIQSLQASFGHVTLAWSGGKDSQALRYVAEQAGVDDSILVISELEFPEFLSWATDNMPWGLTIEQRPFGLDWLRKNPDMLFPDTKHAAKWFKINQQDGQRIHMKRTGSPCLLLGRRYADGNFISRTKDIKYQDRNGWWRASPLAHWSHEDVLCVLGAFQIPLPPCYWWPRGFRVGTGPWPQRQWCDTHVQGWDETWQIDSNVVRMAAEANIPGAADTVERHGG